MHHANNDAPPRQLSASMAHVQVARHNKPTIKVNLAAAMAQALTVCDVVIAHSRWYTA
jgi:hypothetical protein